jgi:hypothetical protein
MADTDCGYLTGCDIVIPFEVTNDRRISCGDNRAGVSGLEVVLLTKEHKVTPSVASNYCRQYYELTEWDGRPASENKVESGEVSTVSRARTQTQPYETDSLF